MSKSKLGTRKLFNSGDAGKGDQPRKGVNMDAYRNAPIWKTMGPKHQIPEDKL